ncbi:LytTR family DNA-binding domain-containing protein [Salinispirillum sp. LH 10-3-1]|uniref:LytTR family DNA-binding domain-containing protein n=1 Tax=Salinispirillum sp. LH 10-3-1 TaxID=2952525 RepID=A0AB38YHS2_9GAMM
MVSNPLPMTAVIADDEPILRFHLNRLLGELAPNLDIVAMAADGDEALALVRTAKPDVVFLDIKMPGKSGLEVAAVLQKEGLTAQCAIVFLTAYDQYAVEAFEREAVDYLLKPVDEKRLQQTLIRVESRRLAPKAVDVDLLKLQQLLQASTPMPVQHLQWINAQRGDDIHVVAVEQVLQFKAEDKYTTVVTAQGEYLIRRSLKQLEEELSPDQFWRVHRNTIVQVSAIERVSRSLTGQYSAHLKQCAQPVAVSRRFAERFKQM